MVLAASKDISNEGELFDLDSVEGGWVQLRRLSHGEQIQRRSFLSKSRMHLGGGNRAERRARNNEGMMAELELSNEKVSLFEFAKCIIDHNLEYLDDAGNVKKFDFKIPQHVQMLDGNIGQEIDQLITELNDFEASDSTGKSKSPSID